MNKARAIGLLLGGVMAAIGCSGGSSTGEAPKPKQGIERAQANVDSKSGSDMWATAVFVAEGGKVNLQVDVENGPPGEHAVHIHDVGNCDSPDASSAGGHWNPTSEAHGEWGHPPHHLGDIGNVRVGQDGMGRLTFSTDRWTLGTGETNDVLGKSVVVHANPDDFHSQPAGEAGARIACGVIKKR